MERLVPTSIAQSILEAPAWARLGIGVRDERLRERAAEELAERIFYSLDAPTFDERQLALPEI